MSIEPNINQPSTTSSSSDISSTHSVPTLPQEDSSNVTSMRTNIMPGPNTPTHFTKSSVIIRADTPPSEEVLSSSRRKSMENIFEKTTSSSLTSSSLTSTMAIKEGVTVNLHQAELGEIPQQMKGLLNACLTSDLNAFDKLGDALNQQSISNRSTIPQFCDSCASYVRNERNEAIQSILESNKTAEVKKAEITNVMLRSTSVLAQLELTTLFNPNLPFHNVLHSTEVGVTSALLSRGVEGHPETEAEKQTKESLFLFTGMVHDIRMEGYKDNNGNPSAIRMAGMAPNSSEGASFGRAMKMLKNEEEGVLGKFAALRELFNQEPNEIRFTSSVGPNRTAMDSTHIIASPPKMLTESQLKLIFQNIEGTVPSFTYTAINGADPTQFTELNPLRMIVSIADLGSSSRKTVDPDAARSWPKGQTVGNSVEAGFSLNFNKADTPERTLKYLNFMFSQVDFGNGRNRSMQETVNALKQDPNISGSTSLLNNMKALYLEENDLVSTANVKEMMAECIEMMTGTKPALNDPNLATLFDQNKALKSNVSNITDPIYERVSNNFTQTLNARSGGSLLPLDNNNPQYQTFLSSMGNIN